MGAGIPNLSRSIFFEWYDLSIMSLWYELIIWPTLCMECNSMQGINLKYRHRFTDAMKYKLMHW